MKALILDATPAGDERTMRAADALVAELTAREVSVERMLVRDLDVRACTGCFGCWTRTPGECVIDDDARRVSQAIMDSDVCAVVTPLSFGCYGALAKQLLDRQICLVLPYFVMVEGEVHHKPRYGSYPTWLALGTLERPSASEADLFTRLVERNAVNMHNPAHAAQVIAGDESAAAAVARLLDTAGVRTEVLA